MNDIIHLLPDTIANQIAAGEVIQRPASVVKELVENAIDAEADSIKIYIKDAGRTLIQVIDNGKGMSETDARMAFERHATSKINSANDLFSLRTMGFRGEALASIAAVAQVELKTSQKGGETGTLIRISASQIEKQEATSAGKGSTFSVKNLFFNVPARRKFLKTNETEFRNILTELERIALVYPSIAFSLWHNDSEIIALPVSNLKQRIVNMLGKKLYQQLLPVNVNTSLVNISGFIGVPESSKKRGAFQYFFVNGRYMRHPYFSKAVAIAFEPFIPAGDTPNYFIYLTVDPSSIDVNIHPTKTEIKFENEQAIWQIIATAVKEAIAVPDLEFDREGAIDMPVYKKDERLNVPYPTIQIRSDYNPFRDSNTQSYRKAEWEKLYEKNDIETKPAEDFNPANENEINFQCKTENFFESLQYKGKYLIISIKSGFVFINQRRAHIRILFDEYMQRMKQKQGVSQGLLFPEIISFTHKEATVLPYLLEDLSFIGFDLADLGNNTYSINGIPSGLENINPVETLQDMIDGALDTGCEVKEEISEALALRLAKKAAISSNKILTKEESHDLTAKLFASSSPNYTPDGKFTTFIFTEADLDKKFK
ncbi:MAG: DNA mismatch repair endonuclease MutL [Dysgonamonadaceae bacterium]|jgi:DNA mismatch repair protein MutL|nr:DNA mismatch repair endonuclease MutL [Dysgonamonadaceae bacterium]